eukprot:GDKI01034831.1.p3 GENE.GDKI01034831.1~~GDKI01034831.1.p3  ORF type:complete len:104 (+),score=22.34 GDKI01034831.1:499-810(+)
MNPNSPLMDCMPLSGHPFAADQQLLPPSPLCLDMCGAGMAGQQQFDDSPTGFQGQYEHPWCENMHTHYHDNNHGNALAWHGDGMSPVGTPYIHSLLYGDSHNV